MKEYSKAFLMPINLSLGMQTTLRVQSGLLRYNDASKGEERLVDLIDSGKYLPLDPISNYY